MKSGRPIDISKSSLVSLKAELIRKKEEADQLRGNDKFLKLPSKPVKQVKTNPGVADRDSKDREQLTEEEVDLLKKSREVLQIKSSLYDQLQSGRLVSEDGKSRYLVDFERKEPDPVVDFGEETRSDLPVSFKGKYDKRPDSPVSEEGEIEIDENEWVEYTDCLGRTRRCHKSDLEAMRLRDKELSHEVEKKQRPNPLAASVVASEIDEDRELMSNDMHLEDLRKKWEDKERELLNKQDVHYEDLLFNEARSHGVGYWKFSTDEAKRREEQEMLRRIRSETEQRQKEARSLRERREQQRQARLIAARQRQRARLGLPPIDVSQLLQEMAPKEEEKPAEEEEEEVGETNEDLEVKLKKAAHVRPWDVGKDGLQAPPMTQEEWVEKKRSERPNEFAPIYKEERRKKKRRKSPSPPPPSEVSVDDICDIPLPEQPPSSEPPAGNPMMSQTKNFLKRRQRLDELKQQRITSERQQQQQPPSDDSTASEDDEAASFRANKSSTRGCGGAEIPPPADFNYYTPAGVNQRRRQKPEAFTETAAAIDAGLRILRDQVERTQNAVPKGTYHIDHE